MQEMGLVAIGPKPNISRASPGHVVYPYLLRDLRSGWPNHIWGIDITYIRLASGWLYLVAVLDWFSRYVLAWELDQTLEMPFALSAVDCALSQATPMICNSDQGSHFTSPQYLERLQTKAVQISMDGKGRALDNIFTERLWRTVKYEEVYLQITKTRVRPAKGFRATSSFTIRSACINRSATAHLPKFISIRSYKRRNQTQKALHLKA